MTQNPFQQNIDIIKGFFRRPITLVVAILAFASLLSNFLINYFIPLNELAGSFSESFLNEQTHNTLVNSGGYPSASVAPINVTGILLAVSILLFYILSRKNENALSAPSIIFKVISIIYLVAVSILCVVVFFLIALFGSIGGFLSVVDNTKVYGYIILFALGILALVIAYALVSAISQVVFANSIRKSLTSIYLKRNGATLFGITCFISAGIEIAVIALISFILNNTFVFYPTYAQIALFAVSSAISVAFNISFGILALKYSAYIKDLSEKYHTEAYSENFDAAYEEAQTYQEFPQAPVQQMPIQQAPVQQAPVQTFQNEPTAVPPAPSAETSDKPKANFCTQCGQPVGEDDYFCNNCGKEIKR